VLGSTSFFDETGMSRQKNTGGGVDPRHVTAVGAKAGVLALGYLLFARAKDE